MELGRPYWLALLAEAYQALGQPEEGLVILAEAIAVAGKNEERSYEAALYHLQGELLLTRKGKRQETAVRSQQSAVRSKASVRGWRLRRRRGIF